MKLKSVLILCLLSLSCFSQETLEGHWNLECGASTYNSFGVFTLLNAGYISPRFRIMSDDRDWTAEEEKHAEYYKNGRFMIEVLYAPPFEFLGLSFNLQYRVLKYKKLSLEGYGGLKLLFVTKPDYIINPFVVGKHHEAWYFNFGLICQINLGVFGPFVDIGTDGIFTLGTEIDLHDLNKSIRKKYRTPYMKQG